MEPEGSLPHSQVPATCPYPVPARSSPYPLIQLPEIHLNTIPPSMPGSPKWPLSFRFPHQNPVYASPFSPIRAICPAHLILLDIITWRILGQQYRSLSSSCSYLHSPVISSLLGPKILLSTPFSTKLRLRSSFNVSDQVSHPHKTTGKITVLYILIFKFFNSKLDDKIFCTE